MRKHKSQGVGKGNGSMEEGSIQKNRRTRRVKSNGN